MKAYILSDRDYQTETYQRIIALLRGFFSSKDFEIEEAQIGRDDLAFCMGCFGCWVKKPGECVINDAVSRLNRAQMNSDVVIFLSPVVFGQFSANIKNAIDRWLPNMLPFFVTRPDGSTMHPPRYEDYPSQIIIGYADALSERDKHLFIDITRKHRSNIPEMNWRDNESQIAAALEQTRLERAGGAL
jgi:hypothetical protein